VGLVAAHRGDRYLLLVALEQIPPKIWFTSRKSVADVLSDQNEHC